MKLNQLEENNLNQDVNNLFKTLEFNDEILRLKSSVKLLFEKDLINLEIKNQIEENIKNIEKSNFYFITKPFQTCDSMGITLLNFLYVLRNKLRYRISDETKPS